MGALIFFWAGRNDVLPGLVSIGVRFQDLILCGKGVARLNDFGM